MTKRMVISADSHVVEPDDLFTKALGATYGDKLPQIVPSHAGTDGPFLYTGLEYVHLSGTMDVGDDTADKLEEANRDPSIRLSCLDQDGIYAEVLVATTMMLALRARNDDMVRDCCAVFNDWLIDYCSQAPKRLYGIGMIHMADVGWATKELARAAGRGMRGVMINTDTRPEWAPYQDKSYDPFWAQAEEAGLPVMIHIVGGNKRDPFTLHGAERKDVARLLIDLFTDGPITLANEFIFGGIMDRFPNLKIVLGEYEISWLPYWLFRAEQVQDIFIPMIGGEARQKTVREYMSRVHQGVIDEPYLDKVIDLLDIDTLMWGSDFPHPRCTYPNSLKVIDNNFGHLGKDVVQKIAQDNAARFYNIEVPAEYVAVAAE